MSDKVFLQEMEATVAFFDIRQFSLISSQLGPVDIAVALRRYYEHVEEGVLANEGRIVKFMSDGVLSLFMAVARHDHAADALKMVRGRESVQQGWLEDNARLGLPVMQYSVGIASGGVLYGELGTARQRAYDVLGNPVTLAIKLARMATIRGTPHLISSTTVQAQREAVAAIEVEGAELGTRKVRLYRLLGDRETAEGNG